MSVATLAGVMGHAPTRLDPTNGEARSWLQDELAKSAYRDTTDPITRAIQAIERWLTDLLDGVHAPVSPLPTVVAGLVAVAILALVIYLLRFVRKTRRAPSDAAPAVLGDERLTAAQYRARALQALAQQRYAACLVDLLRASAREAVDRTLLEDSPSLTAHEIATRLATVFPSAGDELRWAADRFDAVAYGEAEATRTDAERMLALDRSLSASRPVREDRPHDGDASSGAALTGLSAGVGA